MQRYEYIFWRIYKCMHIYIHMYVCVCVFAFACNSYTFFLRTLLEVTQTVVCLVVWYYSTSIFFCVSSPLLLQPASKQWHAHNISEMLACFVGWLREFIQFICIFNSDSIATFAWIALNVKITQNTCSTFAGPPLSLLLWLLLLLTLVRLKAHNALHVRLSHCSGSP